MITDRRGEPLASARRWKPSGPTPGRPGQRRPDPVPGPHPGQEPGSSETRCSPTSPRPSSTERLVEPPKAAQARALDIAGLHSKPAYRRYYPAGEVTAHVLGITNIEDQGQEGLELAYQSWLAGEPGAQRVVKDRPGNVVEILERIKAPKPAATWPCPSTSTSSTWPTGSCPTPWRATRPRPGAVVVLDAGPGKSSPWPIRPASTPTAAPPSTRPPAQPGRHRHLRARLHHEAPVRGGRPGRRRGEPGNAHRYRPRLVRDRRQAHHRHPSQGRHDASPRRCRYPATWPWPRSPWTCAARITGNCSPAPAWGRQPKSGLPGEVSGRLRPSNTWRPIEKATMAFGHGLSVSLLQLARAYTAFANDGVMPRLTALRREGDRPPAPGS
jgi:cell division protein FtsI (penicillin-binding protein 3)